ncbi:MAG: hypothetical protein RQ741_07910 [Wenzhouxiangellaceae bacterium]|nr:hypothetical protein [Wenzhouxiangellaceae bacterium]
MLTNDGVEPALFAIPVYGRAIGPAAQHPGHFKASGAATKQVGAFPLRRVAKRTVCGL